MELECRAAGLTEGLEGLNAGMDKDTAAVEALRGELRAAREEHSREATSLQRKLQWYAENQRMVDHADELALPLPFKIVTPPFKRSFPANV